eukprot:TRINITY_DN56030_c0_g1_i1.p1 TRINITY_DN56030_c0_g1~~TRINITY_DN56030_c0_g1_i1.p1  ORF type:complete len:299 (+),score=45.39 TRINITY_DN56030_c0_g1_i1:96-899(+)
MAAVQPVGELERPMLERENSRARQPTMSRQQSWHFVPAEEAHATTQGGIPEEVKKDFIKKVYTILGVEVLWSAAISAAFMYYDPLREATTAFVLSHPVLYSWSSFFTLLPTICVLMCVKNKYPWNFYVALLFVTMMGMYVGVVCAMYQGAGMGNAVIQAMIVTAVVFFSLTGYCHFSKKDFSFMGGYLFVGLWSLILFGSIAMLVGSTLMTFVYQCCGVVLFTFYILYDTSKIIHHYGPDDYIIASIELYLDIINLFLYILSLLGNR